MSLNYIERLEGRGVKVSELPLSKLAERVSKIKIDSERAEIIKKIYSIFLISGKTAGTTSMLKNIKCLKTLLGEDGSFIRSVFRDGFNSSITGMQNGKGMISEKDFNNLKEYCTTDGILDTQLLKSITGMQAGKGMISEKDFNKLEEKIGTDVFKIFVKKYNEVKGRK